MGRVRGGISGALNDNRNKIMECRMQVSGAFRSEREENIGGVIMVFRVVSKLRVVGTLSSLRVSCVITRTRRGKYKITEKRAVGLVQEGNKNVGALAWSNPDGRTRQTGTFTYGRGGGLPRIPRMDVSSGFCNRVRFDKSNIVIGKVLDNIADSSTEAATQRIE